MLQRGAGWAPVVVQDQHVLQRRVALVRVVAVQVGLHDLLHLVAGQEWGGGTMVGTADQHLAGPDRIPLLEDPVVGCLPIGLQPEGSVEIGDHP